MPPQFGVSGEAVRGHRLKPPASDATHLASADPTTSGYFYRSLNLNHYAKGTLWLDANQPALSQNASRSGPR